MELLRILDPQEAEWFASGQEEVREMLEDLGINVPKEEKKNNSNSPTVGSLLDK